MCDFNQCCDPCCRPRICGATGATGATGLRGFTGSGSTGATGATGVAASATEPLSYVLATQQTIPAGVPTTVLFDFGIVANTNYSPLTGLYTVPSSGFYSISAGILWSASDDTAGNVFDFITELVFSVTNTNIFRDDTIPNTAAFLTVVKSQEVESLRFLFAGQTVSVRVTASIVGTPGISVFVLPGAPPPFGNYFNLIKLA
jgi:hypothetical protein